MKVPDSEGKENLQCSVIGFLLLKNTLISFLHRFARIRLGQKSVVARFCKRHKKINTVDLE